MATFDSHSWIGALKCALGPLVELVTADRSGGPPLTNEQYRALGKQANVDPNARAVFYNYLPKLHADPSELIDLLSQHPVIRQNVSGAGKEMAVFVEMPLKAFLMNLRRMDFFLTRSAVKRGCRETAALVERLLTLSAENRVPGYEITVFRGLTMSGEVEIAPGLEIISYQCAAERGLVLNESPGPANDMPDYVSMGALVLAREITWGPCIVPPKTSKDLGKDIQRQVPTFRFPKCSLEIFFDLLSILTSHQVQVLSMLCCAPEFVDVNSNFGPGSRTGFIQDDHWNRKELAQEHVSDLRKLLLKWSRFKGKRDTLELAVNRLASSIKRDRGRFRVEDRILDTAIALELMYDLGSSGELSYKLRVRAGRFLADKAAARLDTCEQLQGFYDARSAIVHGSKRGKKKKKDPKEAAETGFNLAWKTLQELLKRGDFPDWNMLVMS